eukprot:m.220461 g.220461  ORF g.220461 m.220461 type:complete len:374 (+) comp19164_c0_seq4:214-1335(+)
MSSNPHPPSQPVEKPNHIVATQPGKVHGDADNSVVALDEAAVEKLNAVNKYGIIQGNVVGEIASLGVCANVYQITDMERKIPVKGREDRGDVTDAPLFVVHEESSCCCRCFCHGCQPLHAKFYHASQPEAGPTVCGSYTGAKTRALMDEGVVMTLERPGCCTKWIGCFQCCGTKCVPEAVLYAQEPPHLYSEMEKKRDLDKAKVIGNHEGIVTCCVPTLALNRGQNARKQGQEETIAFAEGPTFFGGCLELCAPPATFLLSTIRGGKGDIGYIAKSRPDSCCKICFACCSDIDEYVLDLPRGNPPAAAATAFDKANYVAAAVHLDYILFENDCKPITVLGDHRGGIIIFNLCNIYCYGCSIPLCTCIPYGNQG